MSVASPPRTSGAAPRLTYVHNARVPSSAANAVQVVKMCDAFAALGVQVTLVSLGGDSSRFSDVAERYDLRGPGFRLVHLKPPEIPGRELVYGLVASLTFARDSAVLTRSISVAYQAARLGRPTTLELHDNGPWRPSLRRRLSTLIELKSFRGVVSISRRLADALEDEWPGLAGRILVAHDGADPPQPTPPAALQDLKPGSVSVGYVGQLYAGKGMELIANLIPILPEASFHIVGGAPADVALWRERLAGAANVVFYGQRPHADAKRFIEAFDIVLAPYARTVRGVGGGARNLADWMSPLKVFEYMSQAKPMVCSDLPVLREVLRDGENALLAEPESVAAWADAIRRLAGDARLRRELGARARSDLVSAYTWEKRAQSMLRLMAPEAAQRASLQNAT